MLLPSQSKMIRPLIVASLLVAAASGHLLMRGRPKHIKHGLLGEPDGELYGVMDEPKIMWMKQRLDHFNPADRRTWKQRYMVNDAFYKPGGPVFLMLGGEGEASPKWLSVPTHIVLLAEKFNALLFQLEHRYYGKSHPTPDLSTANLAYLTSQQALADAAAFRNKMVEDFKLEYNSKWVVFGGSYSGSLAAWFKLKYPHLAVGAVASSAPMVALIDFVDYVRVVRDSLGPECSKKVAAGVKQLEKLASRRAGWAVIDEQFSTCVPFDAFNKLNLENFFQNIAGLFEGVVQYNKDQRLSGVSNVTIDTLCGLMHSASDPLEGLVEVNKLIMKTSNQTCFDYDYDTFVRSMRDVHYGTPAAEGGRQWTYQTCVEFGFFQSSDADDHPFGKHFPVDLFIQQCRDIFDDFFDQEMLKKAVARTNTEYGGTLPQLRNVTFPNGSIDPWHALGILKDLSKDVTAHYIPGTAHCADLYPPADSDLASLTKARNAIQGVIAKWLS